MGMPDAPLFFLIAGEPSGDLLGARIMAALQKQNGGKAIFAGVGGERMAAQGLNSLFPQKELTLFGLAEVIPNIPNILSRINETVAEVKRLRPAALITIDSPDFCLRVAKRLKGCGVPLIHIVAPSVWAWRAGRAKKVAAYLDHLLALLPFEPPYFEREGLGCTFIGHTIVESEAANGNAARFRATHDIGDAPLLTVLPGSRGGEITRLCPVFGAAIAQLVAKHPTLRVVVPTLPHIKDKVAELMANWPVTPIMVTDDMDKYDAFAASTAAMAASGTVALELAMAGLPSVIAYRLNAISGFLGKRLLKVKYVNLVNILLDRPLVPELLQENCRADLVAAAVDRLLSDDKARQEQIDGVREVAVMLGQGGTPPSEQAAIAIMAQVQSP